MAVAADFTVNSRIGEGFLSAIFTDISTGSITYRKWLLGDGTVIDGNETEVRHTYRAPGLYTVTLIVGDSTDQDSKIKADYIIVNQEYIDSQLVIMQSIERESGRYWRFYFDSLLYLYFETDSFIYKSVDPVTGIKKWAMVQFNLRSEKMYLGTYLQFYKEINVIRSVNLTPYDFKNTPSEIATDSSLKLDDLKIWSSDKNIKEYYMSTRGKAGYLDFL